MASETNSTRQQMLENLKNRRAAATSGDDPHRVLVPSSSPTRAGLIPSSNLASTSTGRNGHANGSKPPPRPAAASLSPSTPPLSRLKKKYDDSPSPSKTMPSTSSMSSSSLGSLGSMGSISSSLAGASSMGSLARSSASCVSPAVAAGRRIVGPGAKKRPSLVMAAKAQHNDALENRIKRIQTQYQSTPRESIVQLLQQYEGNIEAVMQQLASQQHAAAPPKLPTNLSTYRFQPSLPSSSSAVSPASSLGSSAATSPAPRAPVAKRRNEKSTIYARREKKGARRDPDEESSGAESDGSEGWNDGPARKKRRGSGEDIDAEGETLKAFNHGLPAELTGTIACSADQAAKIVKLRPFLDVDDARSKLNKARGVSFKLFESYMEIMEGYVQIDQCLNSCEDIANDIASTLAVWKGAGTTSDSIVGTPRSDGLNDVRVDVAKVSELLLAETDSKRKKILGSYIRAQPALLSEGTVLKDYQLLGVNWLNLLYSRKIGCILADEMGLGKTIQVIAFLAHLKEHGMKGPHMIFVPASTLENWTREFDRFAPEIDVQTYYGSQAERAELRQELKTKFRAGELEVVLASYTQVASHDDLAFFRKKIEFETCIYDEAHALKNFATKRYQDLTSIKPRWRLLLTGTPLQNNLQELVSLLMFIHKDIFTDAEPYLRAMFKVHASGSTHILSQNRVSRARKMLTPFVLRRRKANVLDLPPKIETVETVEMTPAQAKLYRDTMRRSRKLVAELGDAALAEDEPKPKAKAKNKLPPKDSSSANIIMDLRKAASHPLLFRRLYTTAKVKAIAKECLNTPKWCDSRLDYVIEDLEIMSDAEIHAFVSEHEELQQFALDPALFLEGGKVRALEKHLERCKEEGKRMLLFSQFTMILDILQVALDHLDIKYVRLDGGTRTDERQGLVDQFNEDPEITVFLLSTKAGGVGINLTAASVVVIFDQDFNPHNDRQAADRAYRIGQERSVEVIKLISANSIDEDILSIGMTKLQLDDMVGGDGEEGAASTAAEGGSGAATPAEGDDKTAREVKKSLLTKLKQKFADGDDVVEEESAEPREEETEISQTQVKRARGVERKD